MASQRHSDCCCMGILVECEFTWNAPVLFREGRHPMETMMWKRKQLKQMLAPGFLPRVPCDQGRPEKPRSGR